MAMGIESWIGSQIQGVILESFCYVKWKGAFGISWDCYQVLTENGEGFLQRLSSVFSLPLRIGDNTIAIAHEEQSLVRINTIQSSNLCIAFNIQQYDDKIVIYYERTLPILLLGILLSFICKWPLVEFLFVLLLTFNLGFI